MAKYIIGMAPLERYVGTKQVRLDKRRSDEQKLQRDESSKSLTINH